MRVATLARLHARACLVSVEVHSLLRCGFASAALARWRTLHETAVVARVLRDRPSDLAQRYLDYEVVESFKAAVEFQEYEHFLAEDPLPPEDVEEIRADRERILVRYGKEFDKPYGWAAELLPGKTTLKELEEVAGLQGWRPYYRMASDGVHAGPKAIAWNLGLEMDAAGLLAGPSNVGLADPAYNAIWSLRDVTASLLSQRQDFDGLVQLGVLERLLEEIGEAAMRAHRALERRARLARRPLRERA
ncbi:MAG: DUF5677 domain-containing protein [Candidatus Eiseniibacteriota bacterium]